MDDGAIRIHYRSIREHRGGAGPIIASDLRDLGTVLIVFVSFCTLEKHLFWSSIRYITFFFFSSDLRRLSAACLEDAGKPLTFDPINILVLQCWRTVQIASN